jgi:hypothetical protein
MAKIFSIDFRNKSLKDEVSGIFPTITGTPKFKQSPKGFCMDVPAYTSPGYLTYTGTENVQLQTGDCIEVACNHTNRGAANWFSMLGKMTYVDATHNTGFTIFYDNTGDLVLYLNNNNYAGYAFNTTVLPVGVDLHLVAVLSDKLYMYINGVLTKTYNTYNNPAPCTLSLRCMSDGFTHHFDGQVYLARIYQSYAPLAGEVAEMYQNFLHSSAIESPTVIRPTLPLTETRQPLFTETGRNICPDNTTYTVGQYMKSGWYVSSGSFKETEDSAGKYISCVTNGTIQWRGFNIPNYTSAGYIKELVGSISSDQGKGLNTSTYVTQANNILSVALTANQKLYKLVIDAYYIRIPLLCTAGVIGFTLSGGGLTNADVSWEFPDGSATVWNVASGTKTLTAGGIVWLNFWKEPVWSTLTVIGSTSGARFVGDLSVFRRVNYCLDLSSCTQVTGNLSSVSGTTNTINLINCAKITGDLSSLSGLTYYLNLYGCPLITGNLSSLNLAYALQIASPFITGFMTFNYPTIKYVLLSGCTNISVADLSQTLVNLATVTTVVTGTFDIGHIKRSQLTPAAELAVQHLTTLPNHNWTMTFKAE